MKGASKSAIGASGSPGTLGELSPQFGFKTGVSGAHTARTMMLHDLASILVAALRCPP